MSLENVMSEIKKDHKLLSEIINKLGYVTYKDDEDNLILIIGMDLDKFKGLYQEIDEKYHEETDPWEDYLFFEELDKAVGLEWWTMILLWYC